MIKKIIKIMIIGGLSSLLQAKMGCIDNSYHTDHTHGPDFKTYHYVACNCPCDRYVQLNKRSRCLECGHFHAQPSTIYIS